MANKNIKKKSNKASTNSKLETMAIAYEFSRCNGYGIKESEVSEMWDETSFDQDSVDTTGIGAYQGNSTDEIARIIVNEILKEKG